MGNEEILEHLATILENRTLRCLLSEEAKHLSEPFHISRVVERYALAFDHLVRVLREELGPLHPDLGIDIGWFRKRQEEEEASAIPADAGIRRRGQRGERLD